MTSTGRQVARIRCVEAAKLERGPQSDIQTTEQTQLFRTRDGVLVVEHFKGRTFTTEVPLGNLKDIRYP